MPWNGGQISREFCLPRMARNKRLGGYASGQVSGAVTRRYHGLLIAALPGPLGRIVMWNQCLSRCASKDDDVVRLGGEERAASQQ